jgi:hypothetical protein
MGGGNMPDHADDIVIEGTVYDRRRRLTPEQAKELNKLFGLVSTRAAAAQFGVSRRTVQFNWYPERRVDNVRVRRERGTVYSSREELTEAVRNLRQYKKGLFKAGKVTKKRKEAT